MLIYTLYSLDPVPNIEYLSRKELFEMKRPRTKVVPQEDFHTKTNRILREERSMEAVMLVKKRPREDGTFDGGRVFVSGNNSGNTLQDTESRKHINDFATVGVNERHVPRRTVVSHEVLVSSVYVSHRLYKLKSELLNIVALMSDFGLYWEALSSMDQSSSGSSRSPADLFIRFIQGASTPQELLHAITTFETVIPLAGMTRGAHREAIEKTIYSALSDSSQKKANGEPLPLNAVTTSAVAIRLFSLDRIIRYERLPAQCTDHLMKSFSVCRTRCDHCARCPFSLFCNKMIGHFGRCIPTVESPSRLPDIRPPFDRMITGEVPYQPDPTTLFLGLGRLANNSVTPQTQFSSLKVGDEGHVIPGCDGVVETSKIATQQNNSNSFTQMIPNSASYTSRYAADRADLITVKILPFDIADVQPRVPVATDFMSMEWV